MQEDPPVEQLSVLVLTRIVNVSALDLKNVRINLTGPKPNETKPNTEKKKLYRVYLMIGNYYSFV